MDAFETVCVELRDGVGWITLNRPHKANCFSVQMRDDLHALLSALRLDDELRVIVLAGAGERGFCGGADLSEFLTAPSSLGARRIRQLRDLWSLLREMPQPTIAALHGYVFGSGVEMALFCDLRLASDDAVFGLPEMGLGILPGAGGTQTVPRAIGLGAALDMLIGERRLTAAEALDAGMVTRVVPGARLAESAQALAQRLAQVDGGVMRLLKRALREGADLALAPGLALEARLAATARAIVEKET
ncbi:MAG: enoyl-CoA hydratase/isomerase family protein [Burkholderiaceae bacterium]|jgi:enoyl-CoA hydratase/carnithine racemase|nr:enoyl-CoA hydratase/isomerase family protein [Burkholderiaceae bacterium]